MGNYSFNGTYDSNTGTLYITSMTAPIVELGIGNGMSFVDSNSTQHNYTNLSNIRFADGATGVVIQNVQSNGGTQISLESDNTYSFTRKTTGPYQSGNGFTNYSPVLSSPSGYQLSGGGNTTITLYTDGTYTTP